MFAILGVTFGGNLQSGEIICADDIRENVVTKEVFVRTADDVIVLVDSSSFMGETDKNRTKTNYQLETEVLKAGFQRPLDLGYNIGVYRFTPWEAVYPIQKADMAVAAEALDKLPDKPAGPIPLLQSLDELEKVLKGLSGKTFVYLIGDGGYIKLKNHPSPWEQTKMLAQDYDVCFQIIDDALQKREKRLSMIWPRRIGVLGLFRLITNITGSEQRRVDLVFGISYSDDIDQAQKILEDIVNEHPLVLDEPEPMIKIDELADSSVNFICLPWVKTDDFGPVRWDIIRTVKERFDQAGISIPFPQRDIHIYNTTASSDSAPVPGTTEKPKGFLLSGGTGGAVS